MQEVFTNSVLNLMRFVPSVSKSMLFQRALCLLPRFWNCAIVQVGQLLHYLPYLHHLLSEVFCISLEHCHFLFLWSGLRKFLLISASIWGFFSTSQFRNGVFFFDKGPRSWNLTFLKCWLFRDSSGKRQNEDWTSTAYGPPIWSERPGGRALSMGGGEKIWCRMGQRKRALWGKLSHWKVGEVHGVEETAVHYLLGHHQLQPWHKAREVNKIIALP